MKSSPIPVINIVACLIPGYGIGYQGRLPWRLRKEMRYFKEVTSNTVDPNKKNAVIMGRKTWDSIPAKFKPLPNRVNVVVSRSFNEPWHGAIHTCDKNGQLLEKPYYQSNDLNSALTYLKDNHETLNLERIYVIGGAQIYSQAAISHHVTHWLLTCVSQLSNKTAIEQQDSNISESLLSADLPMDTWLQKSLLQEYSPVNNTDSICQFLPPKVNLIDTFSPIKPTTDDTEEKALSTIDCNQINDFFTAQNAHFTTREGSYLFAVALYEHRNFSTN